MLFYLYYFCTNDECKFCAKVSLEPGEANTLSALGTECPLCGDSLRKRSLYTDGYDYRGLTFKEFIYATNGLGLPEEIVTHVEPIVGMLESSKIVKVKAEEFDDRCVIKSVTLNNGITLHFAASGNGAVVYKATRRNKKCQ